MGVEVRPLGVRCNIACEYCYQNPQRDAGNQAIKYDLDLIKEAIAAQNQPFALFGGEPLLVPEQDLDDLFSWGYRRYGRSFIQTNGTLINDEHVRMFREYSVNVGISIDGPDELNDARWHGSLERTRKSTAKTEAAIERLCREDLVPSLIVTLHRGNASAEKLPRMAEWLIHVESLGVRSVRLHLLESETPQLRAKYALTDKENIEALLAFANLEKKLTTLRFDVFDDMRRMLMGQDNAATCVWNACDPYTTHAVQGIEGFGQRSNCGRTNKDGIDFVKADEQGFERYLALYATPQDAGGCQSCRFFLMCKGQCPGTAIDGDWRNKSEHCAVWMAVFECLERELLDHNLQPLSVSPSRTDIEHVMLSAWARGEMAFMASLARVVPSRPSQQDAAIQVGPGSWQRELLALKREIQSLVEGIHPA
jgi:uncharacterized protein